MAAASPVRIGVLKKVIRDQVVGILAGQVAEQSIRWTPQNQPRAPRPMVSLRFLTGLRMVPGRIADDERLRQAPDDVLVAVNAVASGLLYRLRVNGQAFDLTSDGTTTIADVRDAWRTQVNASTLPVTASDSGPDLLLTPDFAGAIHSVKAIQGVDVTVTPSVTTTDVTDHVGTRLITCTFDVIAKKTPDQVGALDLLAQIQSGFLTTPVALDLFDRRVALWGPPGDPPNLTGVGTTQNETRAAMDLVFAVTSLRTTPADTIESVNVDLLGDAFTVPAP